MGAAGGANPERRLVAGGTTPGGGAGRPLCRKFPSSCPGGRRAGIGLAAPFGLRWDQAERGCSVNFLQVARASRSVATAIAAMAGFAAMVGFAGAGPAAAERETRQVPLRGELYLGLNCNCSIAMAWLPQPGLSRWRPTTPSAPALRSPELSARPPKAEQLTRT